MHVTMHISISLAHAINKIRRNIKDSDSFRTVPRSEISSSIGGCTNERQPRRHREWTRSPGESGSDHAFMLRPVTSLLRPGRCACADAGSVSIARRRSSCPQVINLQHADPTLNASTKVLKTICPCKTTESDFCCEWTMYAYMHACIVGQQIKVRISMHVSSFGAECMF